MVLTVTEDTPADMLAGSMELLVQLPRENHLQTQRVTVQRSTPMMDLLVQIATAHKLPASSYTLQAIGERGMVLPHQPNTPIGALDALQVKLLPKQGTLMPRKAKQANQPFETTFRLQVHLPRNQLYVSRVSPKMNLGEILDEVCREKNLDKNKYELRHPGNLETLDLSLSLQDYHLQEVTLYAKQGRTLGSALSTQDIMVLQRQEERRRQQAKQGVFGFVFKKSKEGSLSTDSLGGRSASPARSDETGRSTSPLQPPARPQRKRRPAPKPPIQAQPEVSNSVDENSGDPGKDKVVISHSRNSSDSSGYHEASVLSDNPDSAGRLPETLPRRNKAPLEIPRKLAQTSQSSKSLCNLASVSGTLSHGISSTSLSSTGRKKRAAPPPPVTRPLSSAISTQALERIVDSEESLTSDMDPSKPPSDIGAPSKANSDIEDRPKASSDIGVTTKISSGIDFAQEPERKNDLERQRSGSVNVKLSTEQDRPVEDVPVDARLPRKRGKLVRSCGSIENNQPTYSFVSRNSFENVEDGTNAASSRHRCTFDSEKMKLQSKIDECRSEREEFNYNCCKIGRVRSRINSLESEIDSKLISSRASSSESENNYKCRVIRESEGFDEFNQGLFKTGPVRCKVDTLGTENSCPKSNILVTSKVGSAESENSYECKIVRRNSEVSDNFNKSSFKSRSVRCKLIYLEPEDNCSESIRSIRRKVNSSENNSEHKDCVVFNDFNKNSTRNRSTRLKINSEPENSCTINSNSESSEFENNCFKSLRSIRAKVNSSETEKTSSRLNRSIRSKDSSSESKSKKLQKSQSFACSDNANTGERPKRQSASDGQNILRSKIASDSRLVKMQTLVNLDNIERTMEDIPERDSENSLDPKTLRVNNNYEHEEKHQKSLKHSSSFQVGYKLRETKIINDFEKPKLSGSRSFCVRKNSSDLVEDQARLGDVSTTRCYDGSISSNLNADSLIDDRRLNLSPPPLSNLQIFAISTKPMDIPVTTVDPVPNNVDKLPSLPIIQHNECRLESDKKLSILEPPPPGLVSREESTESWNRFLVQLNSILESRAGEFV